MTRRSTTPSVPIKISSPEPEVDRVFVPELIAESADNRDAETAARKEPKPVSPSNPTTTATAASQPPLLFEVAWEVVWQLGGIYTVLRSKAATMIRRWGDRYCLIGPYNPTTAGVEFEEIAAEGPIREVIDSLNRDGYTCHYGRWLIHGRPRVILIDYRTRFGSLDADKYHLWKDHGIETETSDGEVNEVVAFGFAVTEFFRRLVGVVGGRRIVAHFHEWMGGVAVPRIAHLRLPVATVFTTHATLLGRYLASDSPEFYNHLPFVNADHEARKYNIWPRHAIEKAAAHASTVFSTVSEVTSIEARQLLGRMPDAILPNGINIEKFTAPHEFQHLHRQYKDQISEFVMGHFFPHAEFDLDKTIYLFTSGRYEFRNKGMDLFIEAMHRLNQRLKGLAERPTVVAFIVTKAAVRNVNVGVLQSQSMFNELKTWCWEMQQRMGRRLFMTAARGKIPKFDDLIYEDSVVRLKRSISAWRTGRQPPIVTHDLIDDAGDPVLASLRHRGLFNSASDAVKVVFHPQFVSSTSPLISLDYDNFVRGCHMGVFPSYYEPWGYTPLECVALGIPSVTTDLSGFGAYAQSHVDNAAQQGICVLNRSNQGFDQSVDQLVDYLYNFCRMDRRQRIELRNRVERLGELFDWSALIRHYDDAHDMAMARRAGMAGRLDLRMV